MLITISGLYGSGGQEIAEALAKEYGYPTHGKDLVEKAAENSGIDFHRSTLEFYDETDESIDKSVEPFKHAMLNLELDVLPISRTDRAEVSYTENRQSGLLASYMDTLPVNRREPSPALSKKTDIDRLNKAKSDAVLAAAESGNAIFIGRCAAHILAGRKDVLRIFTTASLDSCRERIVALYGLDNTHELDSFIKKTNQRRAYYFEAVTGLKWDDPENYDYCINTDCLGYEKTLELVKALVELKK